MSDRAAEARKFADRVESVLNVDRPTDPAAWRAIPAQNYKAPLPAGLWDPSLLEEFTASIRRLARGKAPDLTGNHAELLHALLDAGAAGQAPLTHLHCLVCEFWRGRLPSAKRWRRSRVLVPIFKHKGDFSDLNNHRGIVLLDVLSKLVCRVLNDRFACRWSRRLLAPRLRLGSAKVAASQMLSSLIADFLKLGISPSLLGPRPRALLTRMIRFTFSLLI